MRAPTPGGNGVAATALVEHQQHQLQLRRQLVLAALPRDLDPQKITVEEALSLIAAREKRPAQKGRSKKAKAAPAKETAGNRAAKRPKAASKPKGAARKTGGKKRKTVAG